MKCYKCQKEMSVNGNSYIGIQFSQRYGTEEDIIKESSTVGFEDPFDLKFIRKQWGKYFEDVTSAEGINICFECWIDALLGEK